MRRDVLDLETALCTRLLRRLVDSVPPAVFTGVPSSVGSD